MRVRALTCHVLTPPPRGAQAPFLLQLARHPVTHVRSAAGHVLQALLLECEVFAEIGPRSARDRPEIGPRWRDEARRPTPSQMAQYQRVQAAACAAGALLWVLPLSFEGGMAALASATPAPAHFAAEPSANGRDPGRAELHTPYSADGSSAPPTPTLADGSVPATPASVGSFDSPISTPRSLTPRGHSRENSGSAGNMWQQHDVRRTASFGAAYRLSAKADDAAAPAATLPRGGEEISMYRRLVALLADDHEATLSLLARLVPAPLVHRSPVSVVSASSQPEPRRNAHLGQAPLALDLPRRARAERRRRPHDARA